jgi:hypothetical protein
VLKLVGVDAAGAAREDALVLTAADIIRGTVAWALASHVPAP